MTRRRRIWGPPGTGKTTTLADGVASVAREWGGESIRIASFSVTAAEEIKSRPEVKAALPAGAAGTLHSHAYRALGEAAGGERPAVALDPKVIADWNSSVGPTWQITGDSRGARGLESRDRAGAGFGGADTGDDLLEQLDLLRAAQTPGGQWPVPVRGFAKRWTEWKAEAGCVDYCLDQETEVLTRRGWVNGWDIREGDQVRAVDPDSGLAVWEPVTGVYRRVGRSPMIHMVNSVHDSMTTPDHRWLVDRRNTRTGEWTRATVTTADLNASMRIPRAAPSGDAATEAKYADAFVELVAWWFTEGSRRACGRGEIGQSRRVNPAYCARIDAALRLLAGPPGGTRDGRRTWSISQATERGMNFYLLGSHLVAELDAVAPDKVPTVEFLTSLTTAQLRMFVDTALDADGHRRPQAWTFGQKDLRRTEAMALAAMLAGLAVTFQAPREMRGIPHHEITVSERRLRSVVPGTTTGHATGTRTLVNYEGLIWCPTVQRCHTFYARRNGKVYVTRNTDMIVKAYQLARSGVPMPGDPRVLVVDEAQDMTPIEAALAFAWGDLLDEGWLIFALDDDQAIMEWRGGDPTAILQSEVDDDQVLARSHRVPPAVHAVAEAWIQRCASRYPKTYLPREPHPERDPSPAHARGWAYRVGHTLNDTALVDQIETDLHDPDDPETTVMVLASCGYMLNTLIATLRKRGIPYHNPFRPSDKLWNPLTPPASGMSTSERLWRYLVLDQRELGERARLWTGDDLRAWLELISNKQAHLVHNVSRILSGLPGNEPVPWDHIAAMFRETPAGDEALRRATCGGPDALDHLEWLASVVAPSKAKVTAYPLQVARSQGSTALIDTPRLVVGTIHSVKGATASRVYVAPDLSGAGMRQWRSGQAGQDQITRLMYVAMTRAYHRLCVLTPTAGMGVNTSELIPAALEVRP